MENLPPLQLEELLFPQQEVRANPQHNVAGARDGTLVKISHSLEKVEGQSGKYQPALCFYD
jgi:hypothetical protein